MAVVVFEVSETCEASPPKQCKKEYETRMFEFEIHLFQCIKAYNTSAVFKNKSENVAIKHNSIAIAFLYPSQLCQKAGPNTQEKEQKNI